MGTIYRQRLLDIAKERYLNKNAEWERPEFEFDFKPSDFKEYVKTEDELINSLGRKWKGNLRDIGRFCLAYQHITSNYLKVDEEGCCHPVSVIPIACTALYLRVRFGKPYSVSRLLKKCQSIGLLVRMNTNYRFGCAKKSMNYSYRYAYNKDVEHLVVNVCRERKINLEDGLDDNTIVSIFEYGGVISEEELTKITLRTRYIGLPDVCNLQAEMAIKDFIMHHKYGQLIAPRMRKIKEMNLSLPEEQRIRFSPNLHYTKNGRLNSIGLRATNEIVSLKAHEEEHTNYRGVRRQEYLRKYFGTDKYMSFDVHASIYQISRLLNFGEWVGNQGDPYAVMFGSTFTDPSDRDAYKSLCMVLYFDNPNEFYGHNRLFIPNVVKQHGKSAIMETVSAAEKSMLAFTGEKFFNEVFLHESLLYIDFVYELRRRGIEVVQVYDGFYLKQGAISGLELDSIMQKCAMKYYEDYRAWMSNLEASNYSVAA